MSNWGWTEFALLGILAGVLVLGIGIGMNTKPPARPVQYITGCSCGCLPQTPEPPRIIETP